VIESALAKWRLHTYELPLSTGLHAFIGRTSTIHLIAASIQNLQPYTMTKPRPHHLDQEQFKPRTSLIEVSKHLQILCAYRPTRMIILLKRILHGRMNIGIGHSPIRTVQWPSQRHTGGKLYSLSSGQALIHHVLNEVMAIRSICLLCTWEEVLAGAAEW